MGPTMAYSPVVLLTEPMRLLTMQVPPGVVTCTSYQTYSQGLKAE